ncbi:peptidase M28 family protein [Chitinophaga caeni]|uniref:Carboxypeptidase Q n=1 Tax=Chitinophaga caeni TaxID=2029983 RepID=A0A291QQD0_9BACT|nr:M20/M25/M40 family metallo-hydrolase [Chitinophaga caeni]ATL46125.1 peptidase M28 family protein [Chitinophaga caeni]
MKKYLLLLLGCGFVPAANAQHNEDSITIRKMANEILSNGNAYEDLRILTKTIGGRLAGSPQMVKAEHWGFKTLENAGADTVYYQECMVPHWVRGEKEVVKIVGAKSLNLNAIALGKSVATPAKGITAQVIEVKDFDDLEAKKDQLKGKIVFYNYHFNPTFVKTFYSYGDAVRYRGQGPSKAAQYGALAVIIRSMSHATDNQPHTGSTNYDSKYPKIAAVAVGLEDADLLSKQIAANPGTKVFIKTNCQTLPDTIGHNVIGELRGSVYPDEYITVGGHLDSWDVAEGAHDDGTGCVQSIEILRTYKKLGIQPKRTLRVVLFANEENGARGAEKYAEVAKENNEKHVFALESDAGGFTPRGFTLSMSTAQRNKIKSWSSLLMPYGAYDFDEEGGGVDVGFIHRALGVPMGELSPDSQRYFDIHHAPSDVFENVNKRELNLGTITMGALLYLIDKYGL